MRFVVIQCPNIWAQSVNLLIHVFLFDFIMVFLLLLALLTFLPMRPKDRSWPLFNYHPAFTTIKNYYIHKWPRWTLLFALSFRISMRCALLSCGHEYSVKYATKLTQKLMYALNTHIDIYFDLIIYDFDLQLWLSLTHGPCLLGRMGQCEYY